MGYNLTIGQRIKDAVKIESHDNISVPLYDGNGLTIENKNTMYCSYSMLNLCTNILKIEDIINNKEYGLLSSYPGYVSLTTIHKEIIDEVYNNFYIEYPSCVPGYFKIIEHDIFGEIVNDDPYNTEYHIIPMVAVFLEWLKYWIDWSIENYDNPIFYVE